MQVVKSILKGLGGAKEVVLREQDESYGNTPLHVCCALHSYVMSKLLIEEGSDLGIKDRSDRTPLELVEYEIED